MANTIPPPLLTRKQVAAYLGCSIRTVINLENEGLLKPYKIGSHMVRYRADEISLDNFPQPRRS